MSPRSETGSVSIAAALQAFVLDRERTLRHEDARLYRYVLLLLELCINNYGHRNLDPGERAAFEAEYHLNGRHFFELFGVDKLLPELDFFCARYLETDVHVSDRVSRRVPEVVSELREWLARRDLVTPELEAGERERAVERGRLERRLRQLLRSLGETVVSLDPEGLDARDYVACDHHLIARLAPRCLWLTVFRAAKPELVGPVVIPERLASRLSVGWSICAALARIRGRWRFVDLVGIYPRV